MWGVCVDGEAVKGGEAARASASAAVNHTLSGSERGERARALSQTPSTRTPVAVVRPVVSLSTRSACCGTADSPREQGFQVQGTTVEYCVYEWLFSLFSGFLTCLRGGGIVFGGFKRRERNHAPVLREQVLFESIFSFFFSSYFWVMFDRCNLCCCRCLPSRKGSYIGRE